MNADNLFWLAINAYHEARGESDAGIRAVCHVVLNRMSKSNKTAQQIVLKPSQFSWANGGSRPPIKEYDALARCLRLAQEACVEHASGNNLKGADHYFANYIHPPFWAADMKEVARIGKHIFLRS